MALTEDKFLKKYHNHQVRENQCSGYLVKRIKAPVDLVWSVVRKFDKPQIYQRFVTSCHVEIGDDSCDSFCIGSVRRVNVRSGVVPNTISESLDILDDEERVISVSTTSSSRRNYTSIVTVHPEIVDGLPGTLVVESYVDDVARGRSKEATCLYVESLIKFNLKSLADLCEKFTKDSSYNSNMESEAIEEAVEDKLKSIKQDDAPMELEYEPESLIQEASSLTVEWMATEVNLTNGRCSELPENPLCPFLVKLFLQHNTYLTEIPVSFFEYMPVLRVLDMSNTCIKTLPSSISKLFRLQELLLRDCEMLMELPPEIRRLTNLKVLDLDGTKLVCLPKQVGWLLQLECLKFSLYRYSDRHKQSINGIERSLIAKETLSKLSSLKELSIDVEPECEWWDAEVYGIITDLGKLGNLETLKLYLPTYELFQQLLECRCVKTLEWDVGVPLLYPTLSNFRFVVGCYEDPIMSCVPRDLQEEFMKLEKCLKYVNTGKYLHSMALEHIGALFLHRHWHIHTFSELDLGKMGNLKFCLLAECDGIRAIFDEEQLKKIVDNRGGEPILGSLHYLGIHYMRNLRDIWIGPGIDIHCLSSLKILAIHTCPKLDTIFYFGFLNVLIFLEELIVEDCPKVRNLISGDYTHVKKDFLPSLKKISLLHLPELKNIYRGPCIASRLEKFLIYNCPKLKNLHPLETCCENVNEIKGESKWWESNMSSWSSEQHDFLVRVFVPLKDDSDEDSDDDSDDDRDDSIDELADAVRISLTTQLTGRKEDIVVNMDMGIEDKFEAQSKEISTSKSASAVNNDLIGNMDMKMKDELELWSKEMGTSKSTSDELVPLELWSSESSTNNLIKLSKRFYWCLVAEPRKNPEFSFASLARALGVVSLAGYNLSNDSIPRDLRRLSSLWELDLSFSPISTLHEGIKWPTKLKLLKLNGCRNLRFLTDLPPLEVLAVNECRRLERVKFSSNKLKSAPASLLSHGCDRLVEVDSVFKIEPIENLDAEIISSWGLDNMKFSGNAEVDLCNKNTLTRKKLPLQGLSEFGILSTFLPKSKILSFFSNMQPSSSITFEVPTTTENSNRIRGINVCVFYERSKDYKHEQYYDFRIEVTNSSRVLNWTYDATVYADGEDHLMWLSYWDMRDYQMEPGDIMNVSVVVGSGFEVKECSTCLVYGGEPQGIIRPVNTCESVEMEKNHLNVSIPLAPLSIAHLRVGHHLFMNPLKFLPECLVYNRSYVR